jgi:hypothetical protein
MYHRPFAARGALRALTGLDFGLRVRVETRLAQPSLFASAENGSAQELTAELAEMVSSLRVYSYSLRTELEEITTALQINVQRGEWRYAARAAYDLADLLARAQRRGLAAGSLAGQCGRRALAIAEFCRRESR